MQATARRAFVVSSTLPARRRLIRDVPNKKKGRALPSLLLGLHLCGCQDATVDGAKASQTLNLAGDIAVEIQKAPPIGGHPSVRLEGHVARIELIVEDPKLDHQSLATEVTKLISVLSFQGIST